MKRLSLIFWGLALCLLLFGCGGREPLVLGDQRADVYLPLLEGKRVAVFTNHTGIVGNVIKDTVLADGALLQTDDTLHTGPNIVDVLYGQGVNLALIFTPEHGFRGNADAGGYVGDGTDSHTGTPICSLYKPGGYVPSDEVMSTFDVLVVDIQDVGVRFYTYYVTLKRLMEVCAVHDKMVVVLDRPNPNGFFVDGPVLDMSLRSGVGAIPVPVVHGMTLGELALMMNGEMWLDGGKSCALAVVPCLGYRHGDRTSLVIMPSPNLKEMAAVLAYPSTCYFEGTIVSLGRGTDKPFLVYGHPDIADGYAFTPQGRPGAWNPPCKDELCRGTSLTETSAYIGKVDFSYVIDAYQRLGGREDFFLKNGFFNLLAGQRSIKEDIIAGKSAAQIAGEWKEDVEAFKLIRSKYLLYE